MHCEIRSKTIVQVPSILKAYLFYSKTRHGLFGCRVCRVFPRLRLHCYSGPQRQGTSPGITHLEILTLLWPLLTRIDEIFHHFSTHLYIPSKFKPNDSFAHHIGTFSYVVEHRRAESEPKARFLLGTQILYFVLYTCQDKNTFRYFILIEGIMHGAKTF